MYLYCPGRQIPQNRKLQSKDQSLQSPFWINVITYQVRTFRNSMKTAKAHVMIKMTLCKDESHRGLSNSSVQFWPLPACTAGNTFEDADDEVGVRAALSVVVPLTSSDVWATGFWFIEILDSPLAILTPLAPTTPLPPALLLLLWCGGFWAGIAYAGFVDIVLVVVCGSFVMFVASTLQRLSLYSTFFSFLSGVLMFLLLLQALLCFLLSLTFKAFRFFRCVYYKNFCVCMRWCTGRNLRTLLTFIKTNDQHLLLTFGHVLKQLYCIFLFESLSIFSLAQKAYTHARTCRKFDIFALYRYMKCFPRMPHCAIYRYKLRIMNDNADQPLEQQIFFLISLSFLCLLNK